MRRSSFSKSPKQWLANAKQQIKELGGLAAFKSGSWLPSLIRQVFSSYYRNANAEYFRHKYPRASAKTIIKKLTVSAAKRAALIGAITGAAVSLDEIAALFTTLPSGGLSLPVQLTAAATALAAEAIVLLRIQLQLIANIAKVLDAPLDPDDPEDIMLILEFAFGGVAAEEAGRFGARIAGRTTKRFIRKKISKQTLHTIQKALSKVGIEILQRSIIKYSVPIMSAAVGSGWNYMTTAKIGGIAARHFDQARRARR